MSYWQDTPPLDPNYNELWAVKIRQSTSKLSIRFYLFGNYFPN